MFLTRIFQWTGSRVVSSVTSVSSAQSRNYAKVATTTTTAGTGIQSLGKATAKPIKAGMKAGAKAAPVLEKKILSVESDPNRLVSYVCGSNLMKEGEDVKIKSDDEYPEWLWTLRTGPPPPIEDLEPDTQEYWKRVKRLAHARNNSLRHLKKFPKVV